MICPRISRAFTLGVVLVMIVTAGGAATGLAQTPASQASVTTIRSGSHPDYGRVVIDTNGNSAYSLDQDGDHVLLRFTGNVPLGNAPVPPRNVIAIKIDGPTVDLILKHGARLHPMRVDRRVVLDILDDLDGPAPPAATRPAIVRPTPRPHSALSMASSPELGGRSSADRTAPPTSAAIEHPPPVAQPRPPAQAAAVQSRPIQSPDAPNVVEVTQQTPPGRDVLPEDESPPGLLARRVKLPKEMDGSAFLVPFDSAAGAAAFRSGDSTYVVFDERRPIDMSALQGDPVFNAASVQLLPGRHAAAHSAVARSVRSLSHRCPKAGGSRR